MKPTQVWSERELGDWEACVTASYSLALLYGGTAMAAPYTQAQREKLEYIRDEPQDLAITDQMSGAVYGHYLRKLSTGTIQAVVKRPGIGVCLTGFGCPGRKWQAGTFQHEVFYLPTSEIAGLLYDPMAPAGTAPELVPSSTMVAWAKGVGPNDAREVRENEFGGEMDTVITVYPAARTWRTKGGLLTGYRLNPPPLTKSGTFGAGSPALADAEYAITPTPVGWPAGPYQRVINGGMAGYLLANSAISLDPVPSGGFTPAPGDAAEVARLKAENAALTNKIAQGQVAANATVKVLA